MLQRLVGVSVAVFLGCSGLGCGPKARSSADAAADAGTGGTSGGGGARDGGTTTGDAAGGSAGGAVGGGGAAGVTSAGAGGAAGVTSAGAGGAAGVTSAGAGGAVGMSDAGGSGGTAGAPDASGSGGMGGVVGAGGAGGAAGSSVGPDDGGADGETNDAGVDGPTCGAPCTPVQVCKTGIVSCEAGVARCVMTGDQPNGTACGINVFCRNGACDNEGCGQRCTPTNGCHTGTISCTTGISICQDTGASVPDGTSCGTNRVCRSGVCQ